MTIVQREIGSVLSRAKLISRGASNVGFLRNMTRFFMR